VGVEVEGSEAEMIPAGYMAKQVPTRPDFPWPWSDAEQLVDIYSVSGCVSGKFGGYSGYVKHNGYGLFNAPEVIQQVARENEIALQGTRLFYYEVFEHEFDEKVKLWSEIEPFPEWLPVEVIAPPEKELAGYDVVTGDGCSPLSCNYMATVVETNEHCLLPSVEQAKELLDRGVFTGSEPGPFAIFAVYSVRWP
jgi:hypothetical protein